MSDIKNIIDLNKDFQTNLPSIEFIDKLKSENLVLRQKVQQLESMLMATKESLSLNVTPEEQICVKQIDSLNRISNERDLTLEEVKKLDFLVKNLKLIRKEANNIVEMNAKDVTPDELLALLDENE